MQTLPFSFDRSASATALAVTLCENRRDKLDLFVDGVSLTAQVGGSDTLPFFRDLARATLDLASHTKARALLRCTGTGPWELGLERAGEAVLVSVYRAAAFPEIFVFERPVPGRALFAGLVEGIASHLSGSSLPSSSTRTELEALHRDLLAAEWQEGGEPADIEVSRLEPERDAQVGFASELALRVEARDGTSPSPNVERRELLPLLFRGSLGVVQQGRTRDVGQAFLFLVAEQLVSLSSELLEAWEQGRALHRRVESSGIILAARLYSPRAEMPPGDKALFLTLGGPRTSGLRDAFTCGFDEVPALGKATVRFARGVLRAVLRARPSTAKNLRLILLREQLIELDDRLREATLDDSLVNRAPDTYRDFAAKTAQKLKDAGPSPAKIRYAARWMATIPGIELSSTFLCGDRLVVGAARETACLDRSTGDVIWRQPTHSRRLGRHPGRNRAHPRGRRHRRARFRDRRGHLERAHHPAQDRTVRRRRGERARPAAPAHRHRGQAPPIRHRSVHRRRLVAARRASRRDLPPAPRGPAPHRRRGRRGLDGPRRQLRRNRVAHARSLAVRDAGRARPRIALRRSGHRRRARAAACTGSIT